jgi:hypothetical protein
VKQFARNPANEPWIKLFKYIKLKENNIIEDVKNDIIALPVI